MDLGHPLEHLLILCLLFFFPLVLLLPAVLRFSVRVPLSLRYFLGGAVWLAAYLVARIRSVGNTEGWILFGMFLFSPLWFSIGARQSQRELQGHKAKALRWLNVAGFAASIGHFLPSVSHLLRWQDYRGFIELASALVVVLALSRVILWQPPTRLPWAGVLPRFPAILSALVVLGTWAAFSAVSRGDSIPHERGLPFVFVIDVIGFMVGPFLIDLALVLAVAYIVAMVVDRLVLRWARARRGGTRSPEEPDLPSTP